MKNMKNLFRAIGFAGLASLALACDTNESVLRNNVGTRQEYICKGDTYSKYAREVRGQYPEMLGKVSTEDLVARLREINGNKPLIYRVNKANTIVLPVYE